MNVLKMNLCALSFSFAVADNVLTIENGIQGSVSFPTSSVVMTSSCSDDVVCDNPIKTTSPEQVIVWGDVVDCCQNNKKKVALNAVDFGYATAEELQAAIQALL